MSITHIFRLVALGAFLSAAPTHAAVVWNESVDGDLSTNPDSPTQVDFISGENSIIGTISGPVVANVSGYDEATFKIPEGTQAFSVMLESYGPDATNTSLLNLYQGAAGEGFGVLLASAPLSVANVGSDLFSAGVAITPLTAILEVGMDYTLEIREGGAPQDYELSVNAIVPEPSTLGLLILGIFALVGRRRR